MDEAAFQRAIACGDAVAWDRLAELYHPALCRKAALLLPPHLDPENAVGEVWLRALRAARRYDPRWPPYPWLATICVRVCLNVRRSRFRLLRAWRPQLGRERTQPPPEWPADPAQGAVQDLLRRVPRRRREILALRFLFELSVAEVALLLGMRTDTVGREILRGLENLRRAAGAAPQAVEPRAAAAGEGRGA